MENIFEIEGLIDDLIVKVGFYLRIYLLTGNLRRITFISKVCNRLMISYTLSFFLNF